METIIAALGSGLIGAIASITICMINNNAQRNKEQAAIEQKIEAVNANYDKQTALIIQRIETLTDHVNEHNGLIDRMYKVEELTKHLDYMFKELKEDDHK